jgi:hypothetical protein
MKKTAFAASLLFAAPLFAFAADAGIQGLVTDAGRLLNSVIPLLIALALVIFFWGLIQYIRSSGEGHATGRNIMIAGIVALFIMVSIWGIIRLLQSTLLNGDTNGPITPPSVPLVAE